MITSALNCAVEQHLIPANPTKGCVLPKLEKKEMNILPPESLSTFFEEARKSNVFELYYIDLATGLRRGELLRLKWSDVDLDKGIIHVRRQVLRQNGAERRVCLPITVRRPNVAGHRSPYAPTGSETGGTGADSLPRPPSPKCQAQDTIFLHLGLICIQLTFL